MKLTRKITSLLICFVLLLSMIPFAAMADPGNLGSSTPDGTPPVLTGMTLSVTTVTAPGEIDVTVSATDDVSGVERAYVSFNCEETGKYLSCSLSRTYWDPDTFEFVSYPDGNFHGTLEVDQYLESGTFLLDHISVYDIAGNHISYYANENAQNPLPASITQRQITVTDSEVPDGTPPVLTGMTLSAAAVNAPGTIDVTVSATDDVSGVDYAYVSFDCEETGKYLSCSLSRTYWDSDTFEQVTYPDGNLHGTLEVDQYLESGTFLLDHISVYDIAGNHISYYANENAQNPLPASITQRQINVLNNVPDVTTSISNSNFVSQVAGAKEDAYIVADYSGDATLPKTAFEAIAGTDKTLDLISDGVTWRFNGNDIVNEVKPIDLKVEIKPVEEHPSAAAPKIQEALRGGPAVVMQFPENGQLPGKATIQVKMDHAMREYLGSERGMCVYYYNNQTGELELVARDLVIISDTYVEFTITHCSNYVLTPAPLVDLPFVDVPNGAWYLQPVAWAVENEITSGTTATTFEPDSTCTRNQVVTFLWRAAGKPEPTSTKNPFVDVKQSDYFYKAVLWAVEKGITTGVDTTHFAPEEQCTRAQVAMFLWRTLEKPSVNSVSNPFGDVSQNQWFYEPVIWAVDSGVTNGTAPGVFSPDESCTRAQIVTFLYRALA